MEAPGEAGHKRTYSVLSDCLCTRYARTTVRTSIHLQRIYSYVQGACL